MSEMYIQRTRGSKTSTNEGRWLAPGVAPRAPGSTLETKTAEARRLVTSARSRPTTTTLIQLQKLVASALAPRAPGRTNEVEIGSTTARDIRARSRSPLRRATTTGRRRGRRGTRWPRLARPRRSGTREHAQRKEGDKSADRGLRLNRSRQQGRSTAYTTLIQLRGLRRI